MKTAKLQHQKFYNIIKFVHQLLVLHREQSLIMNCKQKSDRKWKRMKWKRKEKEREIKRNKVEGTE
ncbi:hypothetical protein P5673_002892 [Acropora cervicornis]|uniref:Uncharacterized protein n=1 Tax=Acropora cervicornis TaxID=6130 RepID=A0AAD9R4F4_ACRCE|nr:hypothetical protein P5673_002892 [Acropora cervicornis]